MVKRLFLEEYYKHYALAGKLVGNTIAHYCEEERGKEIFFFCHLGKK